MQKLSNVISCFSILTVKLHSTLEMSQQMIDEGDANSQKFLLTINNRPPPSSVSLQDITA